VARHADLIEREVRAADLESGTGALDDFEDGDGDGARRESYDVKGVTVHVAVSPLRREREPTAE